MFGEYALYYNEKVVAFICDDTFFLKPTAAGRQLLHPVEEAPAYPGSKLYFVVNEDLWEDRDKFVELIIATEKEVPLPKKKKT